MSIKSGPNNGTKQKERILVIFPEIYNPDVFERLLISVKEKFPHGKIDVLAREKFKNFLLKHEAVNKPISYLDRPVLAPDALDFVEAYKFLKNNSYGKIIFPIHELFLDRPPHFYYVRFLVLFPLVNSTFLTFNPEGEYEDIGLRTFFIAAFRLGKWKYFGPIFNTLVVLILLPWNFLFFLIYRLIALAGPKNK